MEEKEISREPKWKEIKKVMMETSENTIQKKQMEKRKVHMTQRLINFSQLLIIFIKHLKIIMKQEESF